ncbi:hypothetical protein ACPPVT_09835 [Angustibacter sp. McL0619]|uniref:hypothetical protein n=1 Tax=Angustibacter sp. McL0619 TaxID=3415676 RepID=UPI003CF308DD
MTSRRSEPVNWATTRRLGGRSLAWRLTLMAVGSVALVLGTTVGSDLEWPFGSMGQYAFSVPDDGDVHSPGVEADTVDGQTVQVPLTPSGVGVRRAEVEAQQHLIQGDPSRLQAIAVAAAARHPNWPRYRTLRVVDDVTHLREGRVAGTSHDVLATWDVVDPEHPQPVGTP